MAKAAISRPNFGSLLDTNADEVEAPRSGPEGSYLWVVKGMPRFDKSSKKQTEFAEFTLQCQAAGADVDPDAIAEWGKQKDGSVKPITELTTRATFYITEGSLYRLKEFLEHCGIEVEGRSLREALDETPNCQVGGYIRHEASDDGERIFAKLGKTFHADNFEAAE